MQKEKHRQQSDPFNLFGGSIFGKNPFDDPFFTRSFGSMFHSNNTLHESPPAAPPSRPIIEELDSDYDYEDEEMEIDGEEGRSARSANEPFVDHPDDEVDEKKEQANYRTDFNQAGGRQAQSSKVHRCKVTYGGVDGVYYTSSATRRLGNDGTIMEDCKEADKRTGEATHRISRGLHDKGHSVSRKLNSDGKVNMLQTLHNLDEDELGSFEEAWKDKGEKQLPVTRSRDSGVDRMSDWEAFCLPWTRDMGNATGSKPSNEDVSDSAGGRTKKIIRIPID